MLFDKYDALLGYDIQIGDGQGGWQTVAKGGEYRLWRDRLALDAKDNYARDEGALKVGEAHAVLAVLQDAQEVG